MSAYYGRDSALCVCVCVCVWGQRYTYTQKQALVFLDGTQATKEAGHHDDGAYSDDKVGSGEGGEGGREGCKAALRHCQPDAYAQQSTATQLYMYRERQTDRIQLEFVSSLFLT